MVIRTENPPKEVRIGEVIEAGSVFGYVVGILGEAVGPDTAHRLVSSNLAEFVTIEASSYSFGKEYMACQTIGAVHLINVDYILPLHGPYGMKEFLATGIKSLR